MTKESEIKKTKFARILFEKNMTLTEINRETGVSYPTLENLKFGRPINFRHRTLRDVASYLGVTIGDILEDREEVIDTPFAKALTVLSKRKNIIITLQDIHEATGISLTILTGLKQGKTNYSKRTIRDIAEYLEISEEELVGNDKK